jgi:hypothetical protein
MGRSLVPLEASAAVASRRRCYAVWEGVRLRPMFKKIQLKNLPKKAVLWIHDILGWIRIRIRGSMPLTGGSGSADPCL